MDEYEINTIILTNLHKGSPSLKPYKKIILQSAYPPFNHTLSFEISKDAIETYKKIPQANEFNTLELVIFFLECGTHFASDFGGDMGEEFYTILENTFEDTLKIIKASDQELFTHYHLRLRAIMKTAEDTGWGYDDQLKDYWEQAFGKN